MPAALAIVGLAALVAVFAVRSAGRLLVAALLALSGAGTVAAALLGAADSAALDEKAAQATGDTRRDRRRADATPPGRTSPRPAALLLLLAGLLALRYGRQWPAMSGRYERDGSPRGRARPPRRSDPDRPEDLWKALDRGEDPTRPRTPAERPPLDGTSPAYGTMAASVRLSTAHARSAQRNQQRGATHGGQQPRTHPGRLDRCHHRLHRLLRRRCLHGVANPLGFWAGWSSSSSAVSSAWS